MSAQTVSLTVVMRTESCCSCGVPFAIPTYLQDQLRESHKTFYCPNGHPQSYIGKTEADKLRDQLRNVENDRDWWKGRDAEKERRLTAAKGQMTKLRKRVENGVCPCCNRHFVNVERHMKSKHPDVAEKSA